MAAVADTYMLRAGLTRGLINAVQEGNSRTSKQLVDLARLLERDVSRQLREEMFTNIGRRARAAIQQSYGATVKATQGPSGYRPGATGSKKLRYSGGALERALGKDSNIFLASPTGLKLINQTGLDREARHWYRLNAGVAPRGQGSRRSFTVTFSNVTAFTVGLEMDPSPPMRIPKGFFVEGGRAVGAGAQGTSEFHPVGEGEFDGPVFPGRRASSGFRARNFLDAGVASVAHDIADRNIGLQGLYRQFVAEGLSSVQRATKYFKVQVYVSEGYVAQAIR